MNLLVRLVRVVLAALWRRGPLGPLEESVVTFRVWPTDLDLNGHMNNGRYLTLMDLGRVDLMIRSGAARVVVRQRWRPVMGAATIRFRRPLGPFDRYRLRSRVLCWDEKWFFFEQRFERDGAVIATGIVKGVVLGRDGAVPAAEVLRALGLLLASPPVPEAVRLWQRSESLRG